MPNSASLLSVKKTSVAYGYFYPMTTVAEVVSTENTYLLEVFEKSVMTPAKFVRLDIFKLKHFFSPISARDAL